MFGSSLPSGVPHSRYTHEVIELTDGRCYCLACDEVVAEEYLRDGRKAAGERSLRTGSREVTGT